MNSFYLCYMFLFIDSDLGNSLPRADNTKAVPCDHGVIDARPTSPKQDTNEINHTPPDQQGEVVPAAATVPSVTSGDENSANHNELSDPQSEESDCCQKQIDQPGEPDDETLMSGTTHTEDAERRINEAELEV